MKNLVFNSAIALAVIAYVVNVSYDTKKEVKVSRVISAVLQTNNQERFPVVMNSDKFEQKDPISAGLILSTMGNTSQNVKSDLIISSIRIEKVQSDANQTQILPSEFIENMFSFSTGRTIEEEIAQDNAIIGNEFSNETQALDFFAIENDLPSRTEKTIEEVIAEDNAIIGNDFLNEIQALDFNVINEKSRFEVTIDNITFNNSGKTIEEIIAEDNEITGNEFSNETRALAVMD